MRYAKPPIVEAVVGVRFENEVDPAALQLVAAGFLRRYPTRQDEQQQSVVFGPGGLHVGVGPNRIRLINDTSIVVLAPNEVSTSRLAPYPGWDVFSQEVVQNLRLLRDAAGFRKLVHFGVRFINRIDIPIINDGGIDLSQYLRIGPTLPSELGFHDLETYFLTTQISYSDKVRVTIQTGPAPETLIGHSSVLLDIDVTLKTDLPQKIDAIPEIMLDLRRIKNTTFEACISDTARALFEIQPL
jgi:uncharacterized protein (TIGR04255 family)